MLQQLVTSIPESARRLIVAFWPGPLTLLLPRSVTVPNEVTAGRPLAGIRMPAHPVAFDLILSAGIPLAAPSANLFSHTSPTTAEHVLQDLNGRIDAILDAGPTLHGVESTVLDPTQSPMVIYRPGAVTASQIRLIAGEVEVFQPPDQPHGEPKESLPSPGVGIRHYAPKARLVLIEATLPDLPQRLAAAFARHAAGEAGRPVGIMLPAELAATALQGAIVFPWGRWDAPEELAHSLYAGLRILDTQGCEVILCPLPPAEGIGAAIRDRLRKAAQTS